MSAPGERSGNTVDDLVARLAAVRRRIAASSGGRPVTLVAVTKGFGPDVAGAAVAAGLTDLGESYVQELEDKATALRPEWPSERDTEPEWPSERGAELGAVRWHFVGHVQRNKVRRAAPHVVLWHAIDRQAVGEEVARWAPGAAVLVQVNVTGEPQKGGCHPAATGALVDGLRRRGLDVRGLMAVGPSGPLSGKGGPAGPPEGSRPGFRLLAGLAGELGLTELSMGMSSDLEVAVEEGATIVRVGQALFGPRPARGDLRR
jgi:uncharacterized pyridoxal phosphate-containing UPF0001 family protein